jgi:hypothetical protein
MSRVYGFTKKVTEEQSEQILGEGTALDGVKAIRIDDLSTLVVSAEEEDFPSVMERLVNIVARLTGGNAFSFERFEYDA